MGKEGICQNGEKKKKRIFPARDKRVKRGQKNRARERTWGGKNFGGG